MSGDVLMQGSRSAPQPSSTVCIHQLVEQRANEQPNAVAIEHGNRRLSYREVAAAVERLAGRLRGLGVESERLVGISVPRSPEMVIALLAVLKAGGAYVPLDPSYPRARLVQLAEDSGIDLVITRSDVSREIFGSGVRLIDLEVEGHTSAHSVSAASTEPSDLAYVIYTSGSTGIPKGVMIEHGGVVNHINALIRDYGLGPADTTLQLPPLSFHPSVRDILGTLSAGARLVLLDDSDARDPLRVVEAISRFNVTCILSLVPSLLRAVLNDPAALRVPVASLRLVLTCGESLRTDDAHRLAEHFGAVIANQFGPTETLMACAKHTYSPADRVAMTVPAGRPEQGALIYVVGADGEPVVAGEPGELYVGGVSIARGYLNRPGLTAERFSTNHFAPEIAGRLYRTGDLVRDSGDGCLEFVGRLDHQVKIRGHRVELGEVEAALAAHPDVREAAAGVSCEGDGDRYLIGYVVPSATDVAIDGAELRRWMAKLLPAFMLPSQLVVLDRLLLTPNGKLDRTALRENSAPSANVELERVARVDDGESGMSEFEHRIARIWAERLRCTVGPDDDFFDLGGNSLLAAQIMVAIEKSFGVRLPLECFFRDEVTVSGLAGLVVAGPTRGEDAEREVVTIRGGSSPALFCLFADESALISARQLVQVVDQRQAVYGLLPPGRLGHRFDTTGTIEEMAAVLVDRIERIQPDGHYMLVGHSLGGVLAYEVAHQLRNSGKEVVFLALLDALSPGARDAWGRYSARVRMNLGSGVRPAIALCSRVLGRLRNKVSGAFGRRAAVESYSFDEAGSREIASRYFPPGLSESMVLFAASESIRRVGLRSLGWDEVHLGPLETVAVPGAHNTMLVEPNASILAEELAARVDVCLSALRAGPP